MVGGRVRVIDSAEQCAEDVAKRLRAAGLMRAAGDGRSAGRLKCFVTDDSARFGILASRFLQRKVEAPTLVPLDELTRAGEIVRPMRRAG
jgi:hypothetical protein